MIHPDISIVDIEPEGFAHVSEVLSHRGLNSGFEIQVLHDSGRVLNVVSTKEGTIQQYREPFEDGAVRAEEILSTSEASRVVLIDRSKIGGLPARLAEIAKASFGQGDFFWAGSEAFWTNPGVSTAPDPPIPPWTRLGGAIRLLGDDFWAVVASWRGEEPVVCLIAHFIDGYIRLLTSLDHFKMRQPRRVDALDVLRRIEEMGAVRLALLCDIDVLDEILGAQDAIEALGRASRSDGVIEARGIPEILPR